MNRILVGLDASAHAPVVLREAVALARRTGAKLRLLRAIGMPAELPVSIWAMPPNQVMDSYLDTARTEIAELARAVPPELLDGATAEVGTPWDALCSYARDADVDLIVIGSHGYGLLDRLLGTTASKVVNHADRSVLVVREREGDPTSRTEEARQTS